MPVISGYIFQRLTGIRRRFWNIFLTKVTCSLNEVSQNAQSRSHERDSSELKNRHVPRSSPQDAGNVARGQELKANMTITLKSR